MKVGEAFVEIKPDTHGFQAEAERGVGGSIKKLAGLAAGAFAGVKIAGFLKGAIEEAQEATKATAQTSAVIKSTGAAAHVSAGHVAELAGKLSNIAAIDDEAIQGGENLLLTFTKVRNEVGKGNDIFDQAAKSMADFAVRFTHGNMDQAAIQLGKALNDPIKGVTALSKAGVSFNDQQREQIKLMVQSGDLLGAQKIILEEVATETAGAAAAGATPLDKLRVAWANLKEEVGTRVLAALNPVATFLAEKLPGAIDAAQQAVGTLVGFVRDNIAPMFDDFAGRVKGVDFDSFKTGAATVADFVRDTLLPVVKDFGTYLRDKLIPALADITENYLKTLKQAFDDITAALQRNKPELQLLTDALRVVGQVLGVVVIPALRLAARATLDQVAFFGRLASAVIDAVGVMVGWFRDLLNVWLTVVGGIIHGAASAFSWVPGVGPKLREAASAFDRFRDEANAALAGIRDKVVKVTIDAQKAGAAIPGGYKASGSQGSRASGGSIWPGTWLVGEKGPELVRFGARGVVIPATDTQRMLTRGGDGGRAAPMVPITVAVTVHAPNYVGSRDELAGAIKDMLSAGRGALADAFADALRRRDKALV